MKQVQVFELFFFKNNVFYFCETKIVQSEKIFCECIMTFVWRRIMKLVSFILLGAMQTTGTKYI
jgi:hypothetical protein